MVFDQYQRYRMVQIIVEDVKKFSHIDSLNILEIGSNEQCNLEKVLPNEKIQYSDIELSDELKKDSRFTIVDGRSMPQFEDGKYDIVIALDVLEHIKDIDREVFLTELYRVSKYITIICFPHDEPWICSSEKRANNYYKALYGQDHIWLKEHIDNGLPSLESIEKWLKSQAYNYITFQHGNIIIWEEMIKALFASYKNEHYFPLMESINEIYEQHIYDHDVGKINYRAFIFLCKEKQFQNNIEVLLHSKFDNSVGHDMQTFLFRNVEDIKNLGNITMEKRKKGGEQRGTIYYDRGNGFSENDVHYVNAINIEDGKYKCECTISNLENIVALRYDPIEGQNCIITNCNIIQKGKELAVEYSSNLAGNTGVILFGPDPLIVVRTDDDKNEITLQVEYILESESFTEEVLHNFQGKQNAYLKSNYDAEVLRSQLDEANRKIIEHLSERNEIVSMLQYSLDDCRKERDITISILQKNIDNYEREKEIGLEKIKQLEVELQNIKREKEEGVEKVTALEIELENIRRVRIDELETIKRLEIERDIIKREKNEEIENIREEKMKELDNIKNETELLLSDYQSISDMKDRQIEILHKELEQQKENFEESMVYKEKCNMLEARINKMEHTMSWKITKGLRILGSKLQIK